MPENPVISVIVPVYNVKKYLAKCLESIIKQTYRNLEIICVNDGSPDDSRTILTEYAAKDARIKIVDKENGGLSSARNAGLKVATGKYVGFVDADDWIEPQTYEKALVHMTDDIDVVGWGAKIVLEDLDGKSLRVKNEKEYHKMKMLGKYELDSETVAKAPVTCWNKLYKKEIIDKYQLAFLDKRLFEDGPFVCMYFLHAKSIYFINDYFYNYLLRPSSIMGKVYKDRQTPVLHSLLNYEDIYNHYKRYDALNKFSQFLTDAFSGHLYYAYEKNPEFHAEVLQYATELAGRLDDSIITGMVLRYLREKRYYKIDFLKIPKVSFGNRFLGFSVFSRHLVLYFLGIRLSINHKKLFSMTNSGDRRYKIITFLRMDFKIRKRDAA